MTNDADQFWNELAKRAQAPRVLTPHEADELFAGAPEDPLSPEEIRRLAQAAKAPHSPTHAADLAPSPLAEDYRYVEEEVLQLNRNRRDSSADDALLEELRRKALEDPEERSPDGAGDDVEGR